MKSLRTNICGIEFNDDTLNGITDKIFTEIDKGVCTVFTPNSEIAENARENPGFLAILNSSDISTADGDGVILASKLAGKPIAGGKVAGVDLGLKIAEECAARGYRLFILGGRNGVAEKAAEGLQCRYPKLITAGFRDGFFSLSEAADEIKNSRADAVFVCLGSPLQELWINEHRYDGAKLYVGLGGSVNIYAEISRRAPKMMIRMHLEWLWRLISEPSRMPRIRRIPRFLFAALTEGLRNEALSSLGRLR